MYTLLYKTVIYTKVMINFRGESRTPPKKSKKRVVFHCSQPAMIFTN